MTLAAFLVFLLQTKCDQEYPIAPTLCDELCAADDRIHCDDDVDPATCVARCEADRFADPGELKAGSRARCDYSRYELLTCLQTLPDRAFTCVAGIERHDVNSCANAELHLAICRAQDSATWEDLCSSWARRCVDRSAGTGSVATWNEMYRACLEPYRYARGCFDEEHSFVECLLGRDLSCDTIPTLDEGGCRGERVAIDACDPRMTSVCLRWSHECTARAADAGTDVTMSDFLDPSRYSMATCMMDRPTDARPRCLREREDLYNCLTGPWYEGDVSCDVTPVHARECAWEREKLDACAMSSDAGAN